MSTFALVHGAWHDGSCWYRLTPLLEAAGHRVVAPDLPCDDPEAGLEEYAAVVSAAVGDDPDPVLVGHSMGSESIPLVAAERPVGRLVYLCPRLPGFTRPEGAVEPTSWRGPSVPRDELGRTYWLPERAVAEMYGRFDPETAWRLARALRPQANTRARPYPLPHPPAVPSTLIYAADDEMFWPEWCRWAARDLLGADAIELPGGHFPMMERPDELAAVLLRLVQDEPAGS